MSTPEVTYLTVSTERGLVEVHNGERLGVRLKGYRFRFDPDRRVWNQRFRNENELLTTLALLISQKVPLHEEVELKPKHLEALKPCLVVRFEGEDEDARAIVEELS